MARTVDARGLACPQPVIEARRAAKAGAFPFAVLVDSRASCENVRRALERMGHAVTVTEAGGDFRLTITEGTTTR